MAVTPACREQCPPVLSTETANVDTGNLGIGCEAAETGPRGNKPVPGPSGAMTKKVSRVGNRWGKNYPIENMGAQVPKSHDPPGETPFRNAMVPPHHAGPWTSCRDTAKRRGSVPEMPRPSALSACPSVAFVALAPVTSLCRPAARLWATFVSGRPWLDHLFFFSSFLLHPRPLSGCAPSPFRPHPSHPFIDHPFFPAPPMSRFGKIFTGRVIPLAPVPSR